VSPPASEQLGVTNGCLTTIQSRDRPNAPCGFAVGPQQLKRLLLPASDEFPEDAVAELQMALPRTRIDR